MITVYLPTRNRRALLSRAVESVLGQTLDGFELIVVNDASSDDTREYLDETARRESRLRVIHNETPLGACGCRNLAIRSASGSYVTGLDDDDILEPNHLATLVDAHSRRARAGGRVAVFPRIVVRTKRGDRAARHQKPVVRPSDILFANWVGNQIFAERSVYMEAGLFDEHMPAWQDYELWMRVLKIVDGMYCTLAPTYIQDESHDSERITQKAHQSLYEAYARILAKHFVDAPRRHTLKLRLNYHSYPQTPLSLSQLIEYLSHGVVLKPVAYYLRKRLA